MLSIHQIARQQETAIALKAHYVEAKVRYNGMTPSFKRLMSRPVEFHLSIENKQGSQDENQEILAALAREMEAQNAQVTAIAPEPATKDLLTKGDGAGSILDIKIDFDALRSLGKWIYQRLTPGVKVKFKHPTAGEFEFEGRNTDELDAVMEKYERFITSLGETN